MLRPALTAVARTKHVSIVRAIRPLSTSIPRMTSSSLPAVNPPLNSALPSDSFQLLPEASKAGAAEDALFDSQIQSVKEWWASPRYKDIKRPYSAEDVVARRGT